MSRQTAPVPTKTFRGTWDQILAHRSEIPTSSEIELRVFETGAEEEARPAATNLNQSHSCEGSATLVDPKAAASIALLKSWIADAPTDLVEVRAAEDELEEFQRNMNQPRKEVGARLLYPETE